MADDAPTPPSHGAAAAFSLRSIAVAAFAPSFLFGLGEGAILPVVALSVRDLGGSVALAALMVTLIGIGSLVTNIPASLVTARWGERRAIVAAAVWSGIGMAICAGVPHLAAFATGAFMIGMASAVFNLARQSYLTEAVPFHMRARAMSTLGGVMRIGLFAGPFVAAAAIHAFGLGGAYGVGIATMVVAVGIARRVPDLEVGSPPAAASADAELAALGKPGFRQVLGSHGAVFLTVGIGALLVAAVRASRQAVIPLWAEHLGLDAATSALVYGLAGGIDMLVFYPAGKVMDRKGRAWVAVPSMLVMGAAMLLMPLGHSTATFLAAALAIGFGNGIGSGILMTLGADHSPRHGRAHFLGLWRLMADLGATGGPALLAAVTATLSLAAGIAATGATAWVAALVLAYWIPRAGAGVDRRSRRPRG